MMTTTHPTISRWRTPTWSLALVAGLVAGATVARAHPDKVEDRLLVHFATGMHPVTNGIWADVAHRFTARVHGEPQLQSIGPAQALVFNGITDWLEVAPDPAAAKPGLPKREFSVSAWVVIK